MGPPALWQLHRPKIEAKESTRIVSIFRRVEYAAKAASQRIELERPISSSDPESGATMRLCLRSR
jgi:hypothetical protein